MRLLASIALTAFIGLSSISQAATIVGLRFAGDGYDIVSINTSSGSQKTLVPSAFQDLWGGSFITDPEADVGYVLASMMSPPPDFHISTELFRYKISSGEVLPALPRPYGGAMALGVDGLLVSLRYEPGEGYDIITINPRTGATRTLVAKAFGEFWGGSFISDRAAGIGYVIDNSKKLIRFDLETGRILSKIQLTYGGPLALAPEGKLVGIRGGNSSSDIVSIDPETGRVAILKSNAFTDFYFGTFSTDVAEKIGCVLTSERQLFVFDLETGAVQGGPRRLKSQVNYAAFTGTAKARTNRITYQGKTLLTIRKPFIKVKGRATGNVTSVRYRIAGAGGFKAANGTTNWTLTARVKRGESKLLIHASGPGGNSRNVIIKVIRR